MSIRVVCQMMFAVLLALTDTGCGIPICDLVVRELCVTNPYGYDVDGDRLDRTLRATNVELTDHGYSVDLRDLLGAVYVELVPQDHYPWLDGEVTGTYSHDPFGPDVIHLEWYPDSWLPYWTLAHEVLHLVAQYHDGDADSAHANAQLWDVIYPAVIDRLLAPEEQKSWLLPQ